MPGHSLNQQPPEPKPELSLWDRDALGCSKSLIEREAETGEIRKNIFARNCLNSKRVAWTEPLVK